MERSNREIPHYYLATTLEVGALSSWLEAHNATLPAEAHVLHVAPLLKATARALREVPELNGRWVEGRFVPGEGVHLGVATSLRGGGVLVPTLRDADRASVDGLMAQLRDLVLRARHGALRAGDLAGGTATVTSLGDDAPDAVFGVIFPPQVCLVGLGGVARRPWCVGDRVEPRPVVHVTLAADHRATDGHLGARFLGVLERLLATPEAL